MAKKVSTDYLFDIDLIDAIRDCWDRGCYFYPVVVEGQSKALKVIPKVKIQFKQGKLIRTGDVLYNQGDELYEKIRELYLHKYKQLNKTD
tara:strand:- start:1972 stop:2241 length:270 start_codon:yes stop_codon:yes gene_type:complete